MIILAVWNCIYIPFSISFEFEEPLSISVVNSTIDFLFFIDIVVTFRTTYFDKGGEEVKDSKKIAKTYIKSGRFFIDLLASLPFKNFYTVCQVYLPLKGKSQSIRIILKLFGILKLMRITRISKIIARLDLRDDIKAVSSYSLTLTADQSSLAHILSVPVHSLLGMLMVFHCNLELGVDTTN